MTLISKATGNFTAAGTWGQVSAVSSAELDVETSVIALIVTTTNGDSATFVLANAAVDAVAIKISSIITPTGTLTVILRNSTTSTDVKTVTINCADLHPSARGWHVFSFSSHTPNGTDSYLIRVTRSGTDSGSNRISLFGTSNNVPSTMDRMVRLASTAAPASGDKLVLAGEFTGAGTSNAYVVTLDNTATTSFGPTVSGGPPQGITINDKCDLRLANTASKNYYLKHKGLIEVYSGGRFLLSIDTATTGTITGAANKGSTGRIVNSTNASPIAITCAAAHGLSTGDWITIYGMLGNTAANGTFKITSTGTTTFTLDGSTGNGTHLYPEKSTGLWISHIYITCTSHGLSTGDLILIDGVLPKNQGSNGAWTVTNCDANTFMLDGSLGVAAYTSGGTWTKQTNLDSTSTCIIEADSVANVDSGIQYYTDGVICGCGAHKTAKTTVKESTVIGSDTNSVGALVDTTAVANSVITWKEGAKFDITWTGTVTVNGTSATITGAVTTTSMTVTSNLGALTGATFAKTATGAPTVLKVEDTTGWAISDEIVSGASSRRFQDAEKNVISTVDSATQITATAAFTAYHSGLNDVNGDVRAEVINITRNIKIRGISTSLQGYLNQNAAQGKCCLKDVELYQLGSATAGKRGISVVAAANASLNLQNCSIHDLGVANATAISISASGGPCACIANNCVIYLTASTTIGFSIVATSGTHLLTNNTVISVITALTAFTIADAGLIVTGNNWSGGTFTIAEVGGTFGVFQNNVGHSSNNTSLSFSNTMNGVFGDGVASHQRIWRNSTVAFVASSIQNSGQLILDGLTSFGHVGGGGGAGSHSIHGCTAFLARNLNFQAGANLVGDTCFGWNLNTNLIIENSNIGDVTAFTSNIIFSTASGAGAPNVVFLNCTFQSTISVASLTTISKGSVIVSIKHNGVSGDNRAWLPHEGARGVVGVLQTDTSVYHTASPSLKVTPAGTSSKLNVSPRGFQAPVTNGTTITPTIWVRQSKASTGDSADYNGALPRFRILRDASIGVTEDTTLATAAAAIGNWEQLSGTSISFTGDGVARLIVDCDGTTGFINVDDFDCPQAADPTAFQYWGPDLFGPFITDMPTSGGTGGVTVPSWIHGLQGVHHG